MAMQSGFIKRIRDIMRMDAGINGDAQRIEQMVWMLFLKVYDAKEDDWELNEDNYESIIPEDLRWRNWAKADGRGHAMTGDKLLNFVNNTLFPVLKGNDVKEGDTILYEGIKVTPDTPIKKAIVKSTFEDANNYMKDGVYLRHLIRQGFVQHVQIEHISWDQLFQVGEHFLTCHAAVTGENGVGVFAAYWQRASQQVPYTTVQYLRVCAVVDGQIHLDFGNFNIAHNAASGNVQLAIVILGGRHEGFLAVSIRCTRGDCQVVSNGSLFCLLQNGIICLLDKLLICRLNFRGVFLVDII